jgi:hypothetical protein
MMTQAGDHNSRRMKWRTALGWDLFLAIILAGAFFVSWVISDRFVGGKAYLIAAVPFMFGSATAAWLGGRWISDKLKDIDYGELIRLIDPGEVTLNYPYHLVAMVGFVGTGWAIFAAIVIDGVENRMLQGAIYAITVGFVTWSVAGIISLARLSSRHQQRAARIGLLRNKPKRPSERSKKATRRRTTRNSSRITKPVPLEHS